MVFQALLSTGTWFGTGSGTVNGALLVSSAKDSPVAGLRPVDISSARTFSSLPATDRESEKECESSLLETCAQQLQDWEHEEEVEPLWRGQRNYGTFIRPRYGTHRTVQPQAAKPSPEGKAGATVEDNWCILHEIAKNDTLPALALKYNVLVSDILSVNGVSRTAGSSLLVRKSIKIPKAQATCLADAKPPSQKGGVNLTIQSHCEKPRDASAPPSPYKDSPQSPASSDSSAE